MELYFKVDAGCVDKLFSVVVQWHQVLWAIIVKPRSSVVLLVVSSEVSVHPSGVLGIVSTARTLPMVTVGPVQSYLLTLVAECPDWLAVVCSG